MGHKLSRLAAGALMAAVVVLLVPGGPAEAQYPISGVDDCAETFEGDGDESTTFAPGDDIQVQGQAGCAEPNETGIEAILESDPVLLARFNANADGSYTSPVATIPADTEPGSHDVVVRTSANQYVQPITITGEGAPTGLPATGREIALLALWGTLSLVLGTTLVTATRRRWHEARIAPPEVVVPPEVADGPRQPPLTAPPNDPRPAAPPVAQPVARPPTPRPPRPPRELVSIPVDPPERVDRLAGAGEQDGETSRRTSTRASEIVDRLRDEIDAAWGR